MRLFAIGTPSANGRVQLIVCDRIAENRYLELHGINLHVNEHPKHTAIPHPIYLFAVTRTNGEVLQIDNELQPAAVSQNTAPELLFARP